MDEVATAFPPVDRGLDVFGQIEDVAFWHGACSLLLADFGSGQVHVIDVEWPGHLADGVRVTGQHTLWTPSFSGVHSVAPVTDDVLCVANRSGRLAFYRVDGMAAEPVLLVQHGAGDDNAIPRPGSVCTRHMGSWSELFVSSTADNVVHRVRYAVGDTEVTLSAHESGGLACVDQPDGLAVSPDGCWLAVSNHANRCVFVYRIGDDPFDRWRPSAVLTGMSFPHGLAFGPASDVLFVADAGERYVHTFATAGEWCGVSLPVRSTRVVSDDEFTRYRVNVEEGGPKGVAVSPDGMWVVVVGQAVPWQVLDVASLCAPGDSGAALDAQFRRLHADQTERHRQRWIMDTFERRVDELEAECQGRARRLDAAESVIRAMGRSSD